MDEFLKDADLNNFKLPTPQSIANPFESSQSDNNPLTLPTPTTLLTPFASNTQPFKNNNSSSGSTSGTDNASTTQLDSPATFINKVANQMQFEDGDHFLDNIYTSSSFTISPWGPGGFNTPDKPQNPFQQQQQQQQPQQQSKQPSNPPVVPQISVQPPLQHSQSELRKSPQPNSQSPIQDIRRTPSPTYQDRIPPNFSSAPSLSDLIKLVEGFNKPLKEKQIGGKDNTKHCIPAQVVELIVDKLPPNSDPSVLSVRASVLGFDRVSRGKVILGHISDKPFEEWTSGDASRWVSVFDDIVVQFSSHNNGQKLALRFQLLDADKKPVCHVDTYEFETITKRGLEKIKERQKRKSTDSNGSESAVVDCAEPSLGLTTGGQLVKVVGMGFVCPPVSQVKVLFGEKSAKEIHSVKRNYIVCETPEHEVAKVTVSVQLEKKGVIPSNATFEFVEPDNAEAIQEMARQILAPSKALDLLPITQGSSKKLKTEHGGGSAKKKSGKNGKSDVQTDCYGYNILHHACARANFELAYDIVDNQLCDIDAVDNYGRTALFWAMWAKDTATTLFLIRRGADMSILDDINESFLHMAASPSTHNSSDNLQHVKDVLMWLLNNSNTRILSQLLKVKNESGLAVIEAALEHREMELVDLLTSFKRVCDRVEDLSGFNFGSVCQTYPTSSVQSTCSLSAGRLIPRELSNCALRIGVVE